MTPWVYSRAWAVTLGFGAFLFIGYTLFMVPDAKFTSPDTAAQMTALERSLGHGLPDHLRELLLETDGVEATYSSLVYPVQYMIKINEQFRDPTFLADLSMPFDHLFFFGTVADGDEFAFPHLKNGSIGRSVLIWSHESDCREEYAGDLRDYIVKYTVELYTPYMKHREKA